MSGVLSGAMASLPALIARLFSYTGFQQSLGDNRFAGTRLDADIDQLVNGQNALRDFVGALFRADGRLQNGSVTRESLAADLLLGLGASRPWIAGNTYAKDATVTQGYGLYVCLIGHIAGVFANDLAAGRWALLADLSQAVTIGADEIGRDQLKTDAVGSDELASLAVLARHIADAQLVGRHAAVGFGRLPVGAVVEFDGIVPPPGFLMADGSRVQRSVYPDLFEAITLAFTANATNGSRNLGAVSRPLAGLGLKGCLIEGPGVPVGTRLDVDTDGAVRLDANVTASSTGGLFRIMPNGLGNGTTSFNLPDRRGYAAVGRDVVNVSTGTLANRVTEFDAGRVANNGGRQAVTIANANLPAALPGGTGTGSVDLAPLSVPTRANLVTLQYGDAGASTTVTEVWKGVGSTSVDPPATSFSTAVTNSNPGGGQGLSVLQPCRVTNYIIFAGV